MASIRPSCFALLFIIPTILVPASTAAQAKPAWADEDRSRLQALRGAVTELRTMLDAYYGGPTVLSHSWYLSPDHPDRQQGIEFLAEKFARAIVWQTPVIIGAIGSSVTAGYDNCRYDCYPQQLERFLGPILAIAGSGLEVRNAGQGGSCGNAFDNQVWCLPMLVGNDIDIAHYSWTYFEAGRHEQAVLAHEMFYRWSLLMEHAPVPQLIYANDCKKLRSGDQTLLDAYAKFGADILCMTRGLATQGYKRGKWGEMGNPLYETSREGLAPGTSAARRQSLSVMYRNWHPGPLLFQTTADVLAWRYSEALLLALDWIDQEPKPKARWPRKAKGLNPAALPAPVECPAQWCDVTEPPRCIDFEQPVFGDSQIKLRETADTGWVFDPGKPLRQRAMPTEEKNLPQCQHPNRCSGWRVPADEQAGVLSFDIPGLKLGMVGVCCGSKQCGEKMLEAETQFLINGEPVLSAIAAPWADKCVQVQAHFPEATSAQTPTARQRTVRLGIVLPKLNKPLPPITHVIGL